MTISVTDGRATRRTNVADAATWENDVWAVCTSRKSGSDTVPVSSRPLYGVTMTATRSGSWMPRPRRNTASTIEYTAVVIATPTASERIAKVVKRGVAPSRLSASLMSRPTAVEGSTPGYRPITTLKPRCGEKSRRQQSSGARRAHHDLKARARSCVPQSSEEDGYWYRRETH